MSKKNRKRDVSTRGISSYGQHYLTDINVLNRLIKSACLSSNDIVIEIGAGDGRVTKELATRVSKVYTYEIDLRTKGNIDSLEKQFQNLSVFWGNFLDMSVPADANKIVASLPYQITEPFIEKIINTKLKAISLIVGQTFAKNVCAKYPQNKLSLLVRCYYVSKFIYEVKPESFSPPPHTKSAIITLSGVEKSELLDSTGLYLMREVFEQRDKKLINAIKEALIRLFYMRGEILTQRESKAMIQEALLRHNVNLEKPIEQMNNNEILTLYEFLCSF